VVQPSCTAEEQEEQVLQILLDTIQLLCTVEVEVVAPTQTIKLVLPRHLEEQVEAGVAAQSLTDQGLPALPTLAVEVAEQTCKALEAMEAVA